MEIITFIVVLGLIYILNRSAFKSYLVLKSKAGYYDSPSECFIPSSIFSIISFLLSIFIFNMTMHFILIALLVLVILIYIIHYVINGKSNDQAIEEFKKLFLIKDDKSG